MARSWLKVIADYSLPVACVSIGAFVASRVLGGFPPETVVGQYFESAALFVTGCGLLVEGADAMLRAFREVER